MLIETWWRQNATRMLFRFRGRRYTLLDPNNSSAWTTFLKRDLGCKLGFYRLVVSCFSARENDPAAGTRFTMGNSALCAERELTTAASWSVSSTTSDWKVKLLFSAFLNKKDSPLWDLKNDPGLPKKDETLNLTLELPLGANLERFKTSNFRIQTSFFQAKF